MKNQILNKIATTLNRLKIYNQTAENCYNELLTCSASCFYNLCAIYHLTEEEENFVWAAGLE